MQKTSIIALLLMITAGCMDPRFTRFPTFYPQPAGSERAGFQRQDPFPSEELGPDTGTRPRDYQQPRTQPRQAAEQRMLQGLPVDPNYNPPGSPLGGLRRPGVVR